MRKRTIATVPATMTQTADRGGINVDLPVDGPVSQIVVRHAGTLTIATANATAVLDGNYKNLYQNFRLQLDGRDFIVTGVDLRYNLRRTELLEGRTMENSTTPAVTAATYTVEMTHVFYCALPNFPSMGRHPGYRTTELDMRRYRTAKLFWDEKALNNWVTPDATTVLSVGTLATEVSVWEPEEDDERTRSLRKLLLTLEQKAVSYTATGALSDRAFDLLDERTLRQIYLQVRGAGAPLNNLSNLAFQVFRGQQSNFLENRSGGLIQSDLQRYSGVQVGQGASADFRGDYWLTLDSDGDGSDLAAGDFRRRSGVSSAVLVPSISAASSGVRDVTMLIEKIKTIE